MDFETPAVWIGHKDGERCAGCGEGLGPGRLVQLNRETGPRCMKCSGYEDLVFLGSGDAGLTRRATALSSRHAVVVRFFRARKRNERQGVLVEGAALERAKAACFEDESKRREARRRRQARDVVADEEYKKRFTAEILRLFPACPPAEADEIARHACQKYSGRVGRSAAAKGFDAKAIELAVLARIRHAHTGYDQLLSEGMEVADARSEIRRDVERVCAEWRSGGKRDSVSRDGVCVEKARTVVSFSAALVSREAAYVVEQARRGVETNVAIGPLVFFSMGSGDAWVVDRGEGLASRLMDGWRMIPFRVLETESRVAIEWNGRFELQADDFVFINRRGRLRRFEGYPVDAIRRRP